MMLSRDADACYWIGRYVERAEATARMVDVHYHSALETSLPNGADDVESDFTQHWATILAISGLTAAYQVRSGTHNDQDALHFFAFDPHNPDSILSTWKKARENARSIREQLASEMWESLNVLSGVAGVERGAGSGGTPHEFFERVKNASHLFQGILNRSMLMGEARDWLDTGRFLERAGQTARLLDVRYHDLLARDTNGKVEASEEASLPGAPPGVSALEMQGGFRY